MTAPNASRSLRLTDFRTPGLPDDRRREPRSPIRRRIVIERLGAPEGEETCVDVRLIDCSPRGLGFIATFPMEPGESFIARLSFRGLTLVLYTVRHCRPTAPGKWLIGAEFDGYTGTPQDHDGTALMDALTGKPQ
jgi:hypothetical protein